MLKNLMLLYNDRKYYHLIVSIFSYVTLFSFPLYMIYMFIMIKLNYWFGILGDSEGYGLGILAILAMLISLFFSLPALIFNKKSIDLFKNNFDTMKVLFWQTIFILPCFIFWILVIVLLLIDKL